MQRRLALATLLLLATAQPGATQDATTTSATVLASMQAFHEHVETLHARFVQTAWIDAYRRSMRSSGGVQIARPDRVRFDYDRPSGRIVVADGDSALQYDPSDDPRFPTGQVSHGTTDVASIVLGVLTDAAHIERDFAVALHPSSSAPAHTIGIELRPRVAHPGYARIVLYVADDGPIRGAVMRLSYEDHAGNWNWFDFTFADDAFTRAIDDSVFRFTPPAGTREISLPG
jgi:outer membrane lipoprotein carrier protein